MLSSSSSSSSLFFFFKKIIKNYTIKILHCFGFIININIIILLNILYIRRAVQNVLWLAHSLLEKHTIGIYKFILEL
jgi:hypothetical protein